MFHLLYCYGLFHDVYTHHKLAVHSAFISNVENALANHIDAINVHQKSHTNTYGHGGQTPVQTQFHPLCVNVSVCVYLYIRSTWFYRFEHTSPLTPVCMQSKYRCENIGAYMRCWYYWTHKPFFLYRRVCRVVIVCM